MVTPGAINYKTQQGQNYFWVLKDIVGLSSFIHVDIPQCGLDNSAALRIMTNLHKNMLYLATV